MNNPPTHLEIEQQQLAVLLEESRAEVAQSWFDLINQSVGLKISPEVLFGQLQNCVDASILEYRTGVSSSLNAVFTEFGAECLKQGNSVSDAIEAMLLFRQSFRCLNAANDQQAPLASTACLSRLEIWADRLAASSLARYIEQVTGDLQKQQERMAILQRVLQAANSSLELEAVLRVVSEEVVKALGRVSVNSYLFPSRSQYGNYYLLGHLPDYQVPDPPENFGMDALLRKEPVTCYDASTDPRTDKETVKKFGLKSLMAFPLLVRGEAIAAGLIVAEDYRHFTQEETDLVMGIASSGAMAVENARLHEQGLEMAITQERNRLAQEMHDQIAQSLAIVKLNLNELQAGELGQKEKDLVREMKTLVNDTYVDLRDTVFSLRALQEADIQFLDSFRDYTSTFGAHNHLDIQFGITERDLVQFSRQARLQIGRIIEEALNNVRKHASANHVWIRAGVSEFEGWIMIEDDGIGIDLEKVNGDSQGHFGLPMMKERAESVGGRLEVSLRPEGGTCVKIEIPFQKVPA